MERERLGYLVLGVGFAALADGVVLHQVLQWHHLWTARTPADTLDGLEHNTLADGIFHLSSIAVLTVGLALVVGRRIEGRPLVGYGLVGWGVFHVVDQLVFHLALGAHDIREDVADPALYNWGFFALGLALTAAGLAVVLRGPAAARGRRGPG